MEATKKVSWPVIALHCSQASAIARQCALQITALEANLAEVVIDQRQIVEIAYALTEPTCLLINRVCLSPLAGQHEHNRILVERLCEPKRVIQAPIDWKSGE